MTSRGVEHIEWVRSSYSSSSGGECLEFSRGLLGAGAVPVRDSKDGERSQLRFPAQAWSAFVAAAVAEPAACPDN